MAGIDPDIVAWLGPTELTPQQLDRFISAWDDVSKRYGEDDQSQADAALWAAVQYLLGETDAAQAGADLLRARIAEADARAAARQVAVMAVEDGAPAATTARAVGVDRMALLSWLGRR